MSDINHLALVNYFQFLAENHKGINGFFRMDLTEIMGSFRSKANFPCLVLESHEGDLGDSSAINTANDRRFAFTVYDNPKKDDYDDQNIKLSECEVNGLKVIARMKHDSSDPEHFLYNHFNVRSVTYSKVGPVFSEKLYGYRFEGSISGNDPLVYDPADWSDDPDSCI